MVARRAAVVPEVADVGCGVVVRGPAAHAVLRVRSVLEGRSRVAWIVEAEAQSALSSVCEVGDDRVVRVDDESRLVG